MIRVILIAILILLIARAFWRLVDGILEAASGRSGRDEQKPPVRLVRDPVCGTWVPERDSMSLTVRGTTHYFCSEQCRSSYRKRA